MLFSIFVTAFCSLPLSIFHNSEVGPILLFPLMNPFKHSKTIGWAGKNEGSVKTPVHAKSFKSLSFLKEDVLRESWQGY